MTLFWVFLGNSIHSPKLAPKIFPMEFPIASHSIPGLGCRGCLRDAQLRRGSVAGDRDGHGLDSPMVRTSESPLRYREAGKVN